MSTKTTKYGLHIDYVPIVQAMFNKTVAYDACIKLYADELGDVPYKTLQPIVERTNMNEMLEKWIFQKSCKKAKQMIMEHEKFDYISVNISVNYLKNENYISNLLEIFEKSEIPSEKICIEIAESGMKTEADSVINKLHELKREGFMIAIDDYNTVYIPLSRLDSVPADIIKLDKNITNKVQIDKNAEQTVKSIVQRAKQIGCEVIAKSVEDQKHKYLLIALGCDKIQGAIAETPVETKVV